MSNSKKIVVFGGAGFLGSHVADALTRKGFDVVIFDMVQSKFINEKQKMIVGDILDPEQVNEAVRNSQYIYHFAGFADINEAKVKPVKTITSNILRVAALNQRAQAWPTIDYRHLQLDLTYT